jgi:3D (Asp-Asp-Asp) domain-containing protein
MKPHAFLPDFPALVILAAACLHLTAAGATAPALEDPLSWTSRDGVSIRARLAGCNETHVFLVKDGRYHKVPMELLSRDSIAKAKRLLGDVADVKTPATQLRRTPTPADAPVISQLALPAVAVAAPAAGSTPVDRHGMALHPFTVRTRIVRTTAYSCGEEDHLAYGSLNALGTPLKYGSQLRSAAADWSVYPAGTLFRIKGLPWLYVVDDYGSALAGTGTIDIYHPDMQDMKRWGRRNVEVTIVRWGSLRQSAEILAGRKRHAHCRLMLDAILRKAGEVRGLACR